MLPEHGEEAILLARHGATAASGLGLVVGLRDIALTPAGHEEAARLGQVVEDLGMAGIHASPLRRAAETAQIAAARLGLNTRLDARLTETDKGCWEGRALREIKAVERPAYDMLRHRTAQFRYPGGESVAEHQRRVVAALGDIADGPLPALVVCHSGTIRCALALGHPHGLAAWRDFTVPNATPIGFDIAWLARGAGELSIRGP